MRGESDSPFEGIEFALGIDVRVAVPWEMRETILATTGMRPHELEEYLSHNVTIRGDGGATSALDTIDPMVRWMTGEALARVLRRVEQGERDYRRAQEAIRNAATDDSIEEVLTLDSEGPMEETPIGIAYGDGFDDGA